MKSHSCGHGKGHELHPSAFLRTYKSTFTNLLTSSVVSSQSLRCSLCPYPESTSSACLLVNSVSKPCVVRLKRAVTYFATSLSTNSSP